MADKERDKWDKIDILLKPVLTTVIVTVLGFIAQNTLENRQRIETKAQLYADLMSKREEAESGLRKDMFKSVIESFLKPEPKASIGPKEKVLNLELLVSNFHESLNLKPLFVDLRKEIGGSKKDSQESKEEYLDRLDGVARDATRKQMLILETYGGILESTVDLKNRKFIDKDTGERTTFDDQDITVDKVKRHFQAKIEAVEMKTKVIRLRVNVTTPTPDGGIKVPDVELSFVVVSVVVLFRPSILGAVVPICLIASITTSGSTSSVFNQDFRAFEVVGVAATEKLSVHRHRVALV